MQSGFSNDTTDKFAEEYMSNIIALMEIFIEDAVGLSIVYVQHSGRKSVGNTDVCLALKTRAYHGNEFWNRDDIQERINAIKANIEEETTDSEMSESESESEMLEENLEIWSRSLCDCEICTALNGIDTVWINWSPSDRMNKSIKDSINSVCRVQHDEFPEIIDDL